MHVYLQAFDNRYVFGGSSGTGETAEFPPLADNELDGDGNGGGGGWL